MSKDASHFRFKDLSKILPSNDFACPPNGYCVDALQTTIIFKLKQETDVANKPKNFFQLQIPKNFSKSEKESITELILHNDTTSGDLTVEGSIKQLKNLMKNNLIVKPSCVLDNFINLTAKVQFAQNGAYSE